MTADYVATYNPAIICALIIGICLSGIVATEARRRMGQEKKRNKRKAKK
jgi:hypothetical protein